MKMILLKESFIDALECSMINLRYRQLGSYSRRKQVWTYSVLVENKFRLFQVLGDRIYEMRCLFVAVGPNARFIVLPHWDNMS